MSLADMSDIDERAYALSGPASTIRQLTSDLNCISRTTMSTMEMVHVYDQRIDPPSGVLMQSLGLLDFFIGIVGGKNHE